MAQNESQHDHIAMLVCAWAVNAKPKSNAITREERDFLDIGNGLESGLNAPVSWVPCSRRGDCTMVIVPKTSTQGGSGLPMTASEDRVFLVFHALPIWANVEIFMGCDSSLRSKRGNSSVNRLAGLVDRLRTRLLGARPFSGSTVCSPRRSIRRAV
jgi:hypothetical protein